MRVLALVLLAMASAARAYEVPAFVKVQVCTPFKVVIGASSYPNHYNVTVEGDSSVASAVSAKVANGVLYLESDGDFSTQNPVKVTVRSATLWHSATPAFTMSTHLVLSRPSRVCRVTWHCKSPQCPLAC